MSTTLVPLAGIDRVRLQQLAQRIRRAVRRATLAPDLATKVECWEEYRTARSEALALLAAPSEPPAGPQL